MNKKLSFGEKAAYGLGAVGKDMVYMLSASYILYYYEDIMGVSAWAMGIILLVARVFDAFNDPIMGVLVAKTRTRFGKFRPWLLIGTVTNAVILYLMFAAPPTLSGGGLVAYAAVFYIVWGVTYTMMDIPYWSMIPAFTEGGKERENLSALARSCAGVGSALITIVTVMAVAAIGTFFAGEGAADAEIERLGFQYFALIVAVIFILFTTITCLVIKEKSTVDMKTASVGEMFKALVQNDQAMAMVITIVLVNVAVYTTSNLVIYFFKYDFGGAEWKSAYTIFNTFGGGIQIISMMLFFPLLRKAFSAMKIFYISAVSAVVGFAALLVIAFTSMQNVYLLLVPGFFIFAAVGLLNVLTTVFLANTVDYGELKNNRRDESVIFSMQTFVVKLASGIAALFASICLTVFHISSDEEAVTAQVCHALLRGALCIGSDEEAVTAVGGSSVVGLRMTMTILPIIVLIAGVFVFKKKYILSDEKIEEISRELEKKKVR